MKFSLHSNYLFCLSINMILTVLPQDKTITLENKRLDIHICIYLQPHCALTLKLYCQRKRRLRLSFICSNAKVKLCNLLTDVWANIINQTLNVLMKPFASLKLPI